MKLVIRRMHYGEPLQSDGYVYFDITSIVLWIGYVFGGVGELVGGANLQTYIEEMRNFCGKPQYKLVFLREEGWS